MTTTTLSAYAGSTARMLVDPEALHVGEAASESSVGAFPITSAACATYPLDLEWVPDRERRVVPDLMAALCRRCPGRQQCLLWALAGGEQGYWAGSTAYDRQQMQLAGESGVWAVDRWQSQARLEASNGALHELGQGSYWWYRRRGCRCAECRQANADTRARERSKSRDYAA